MKKTIILFSVLAILFASACKKSKTEDPINTPTSNVVEISGDIKVNTTWTSDKIYLLKGFVYVTDGATLTIQPGTIIKGDKISKGTLIITRTSKISAIGTATNPIVFTSNFPSGSRNAGDWGGIILLGKAPVNQSGGEVVIEGGLLPTAGGTAAKYTTYGGTDAADNSGTMKYVRIEYAGVPFATNNEINALTMGGVGSGTTLEYIQVYRSGDDAFEWFGGTVNAKYLLAIGTWDDDFDTDFGYSGKVQFALAQRVKEIADVSGSNGFESDNDATGTASTPKTSPIFSNVTIIGPQATATTTSGFNANFQHAAQIRRNSAMSLFNSVLGNYVEGIYIDDNLPASGNKSSDNYTAGSLVIKNNLIYGSNTKYNATTAPNAGEVKGKDAASKAVFDTGLRADNTFASSTSVSTLLTAGFAFGAEFVATGVATPNFTVVAASAAASGALFSDAKFTSDTFFDKSVTFRGAFGATDWSAGWAKYDPSTLDYTTPGKVMSN
jgi:hypothetical protein